jgi:hypothetical protein
MRVNNEFPDDDAPATSTEERLDNIQCGHGLTAVETLGLKLPYSWDRRRAL